MDEWNGVFRTRNALGGSMRVKVGDLVRHIRGNDSIGIVMAVHIFPHDSHWADVMWCYEDRTYKERMRNLEVICE